MTENEFKYLLVVIDYLLRFCILQPIPKKKDETIASVIFEQIICTFTTPKTIITANGTEFNNQILEQLSTIFNINKENVLIYKLRAVDTCRNGEITPGEIVYSWRVVAETVLDPPVSSLSDLTLCLNYTRE